MDRTHNAFNSINATIFTLQVRQQSSLRITFFLFFLFRSRFIVSLIITFKKLINGYGVFARKSYNKVIMIFLTDTIKSNFAVAALRRITHIMMCYASVS